MAAAGGIGASIPPRSGQAQTVVSRRARIVIIGAGAAAKAIANLLVRRIDGAQITIPDRRQNHITGLKPADYVLSQTAEWLPAGVSQVAEDAAVVDRAVSWHKFLLAQISKPVRAVAAVLFVLAVTNSGLGDLGGPIDVIVLSAVALAGAVGMAILVHTVQSLITGKQPPRGGPQLQR